jgi:small ligand-binding sensory domain FIST
VRHLIGLDTAGRGIAIGASVAVGLPVSFCTRDTRAAARDLTRICAELREEIEPQDRALSAAQAAAAARAPGGDPESGMASAIAGAVYVTCAGRGGPHFGSPSAELALVQRALGDVPLVGFFAAGEIARRHLYGYTGVLTLFPR